MPTTSPTPAGPRPARHQALAACIGAVTVAAAVLLLSSPSSAAPPQLPPGKATVAGTVWSDLDADGVHDAGEGGLSGLTVHLVNGGAFQAFATTAADGTYAFTDVPAPWPYTLSVGAPAGRSFSPQHAAAATAATDSDLDADGTISLTVDDGQTLTLDAGLFDPSTTTTTTSTTSTTAPSTTTTTAPPSTSEPVASTTAPATTAPATTVVATTDTTEPPTTAEVTTSTTEAAVVAGTDVTRDPGEGAAVLGTSTTASGPELARTGSGMGQALAIGLLLIALGSVLAAVSKARAAA